MCVLFLNNGRKSGRLKLKSVEIHQSTKCLNVGNCLNTCSTTIPIFWRNVLQSLADDLAHLAHRVDVCLQV